jgi:hypothetical protein
MNYKPTDDVHISEGDKRYKFLKCVKSGRRGSHNYDVKQESLI